MKDYFKKIQFNKKDISNKFSKFLDQKMTHLSLWFTHIVLKAIKQPLTKQNIKNKLIESIQDENFKKYLNIINKESINDKYTLIVQTLQILVNTKICYKKNNEYFLINENSWIWNMFNNEMKCLEFITLYFEKVLSYFSDQNNIIETIKNKSNNSNKKHFEKNEKKEIVSFFQNITNLTEKNLTRILNKPIQYISYKYKPDKWYKLDELRSYLKIAFANSNYMESILNKTNFNHDDKNNNHQIQQTIGYDQNINTKTRVNQVIFRKKLFNLHKNMCMLSNVDIDDVLIASHIVPWIESNEYEKIDPYNGLILNASIDKLFDKHLISFNEKGFLIISEKLKNKYPNYRELLIKLGINKKFIDGELSIFFGMNDDVVNNIEKYMQFHRKKTKNNS